MAIDFTGTLDAITTLATAIVAGCLASSLWAWRRQLGFDTLLSVAAMGRPVVAAVEQTLGSGNGPQKKARAVAIMAHVLSSRGLRVPGLFISVALEAAVLSLPHPSPAAGNTVTHTYTYDAACVLVATLVGPNAGSGRKALDTPGWTASDPVERPEQPSEVVTLR